MDSIFFCKECGNHSACFINQLPSIATTSLWVAVAIVGFNFKFFVHNSPLHLTTPKKLLALLDLFRKHMVHLWD